MARFSEPFRKLLTRPFIGGDPDGKAAAVGFADMYTRMESGEVVPLIWTAKVGLLPSPGVQARSHQLQTGRSPVQPASLPVESAINIDLSVGDRVAARREQLMDGDILPLRCRPSPADADGLNVKDVECQPLPWTGANWCEDPAQGNILAFLVSPHPLYEAGVNGPVIGPMPLVKPRLIGAGWSMQLMAPPKRTPPTVASKSAFAADRFNSGLTAAQYFQPVLGLMFLCFA